MKRILLTGAFQYTKEQFKEIKELGYCITFVQEEREKLYIDVSLFDVVVCNQLFVYNDISKFKNLKLIQLTSVGFDRVPLDYIKQKNIEIYNANDVYAIPMAEWTISKILEISKKSKTFYEQQKKHIWKKHRDIIELTDKRVAIIGYGNVGEEIAKRLKPFGVYVIGLSRSKKYSINLDEWVAISNIEKVLELTDINIITLPLSKGTHHFINENILNAMKSNSIFVNLSRGEILNETALIKQLDKKKFKGVALDVFASEPLSYNSKLWGYFNVYLTPHVAFIGSRNDTKLYKKILGNISDNTI